MGAPKHTPGPWVVVEGRCGPGQVGAWICTIGNNPGDPAVFSTVLDGDKFVFGDKVADARLIAAVPEMPAKASDATRSAASSLKARGYVPGSSTDGWAPEVQTELRSLVTVRAAIAKAEG